MECLVESIWMDFVARLLGSSFDKYIQSQRASPSLYLQELPFYRPDNLLNDTLARTTNLVQRDLSTLIESQASLLFAV